MPDFTSYVPPGVYVSDTSEPVVTPTTITTNTVTVIGPSQGYQTATDMVQVYWNSNTALSHRGIFTTALTGPPAIGAPVVKTTAGVLLVYNVDYTWVIDTSGGGGAANAITYIKRLGPVGTPSGPSPTAGTVDGDFVTVTYNYADANYYTPQLFSDPSLIAAAYGPALTDTVPANPNASQVVCSLTLAAQLAMLNGASSVLCLPTNPVDGTIKEQFLAAYAKLAADYRAMLLVPLFVDGSPQASGSGDAHSATAVTALIQDITAHCNAASAEGYGRMAFVGVETNYDSVTKPFDQLATGTNAKRTVLAYPNQINLYNSRLSQTTVVSGYFLAAAMAGKLAGQTADTGLTKQPLTGFNGLPAVLAQSQTKAFKDSLSKAGVCVAEVTRSGTLEPRHGVTTRVVSLTEREISIVRSGDVLFEMIQTGMEATGLIGQPIDATMTTRVKGALSGLLEQAVSERVIQAYGNLAVRQQALPSGDPSIIECQFAYAPAVPLNYIMITFAIDLTTGALTSDNTALAA